MESLTHRQISPQAVNVEQKHTSQPPSHGHQRYLSQTPDQQAKTMAQVQPAQPLAGPHGPVKITLPLCTSWLPSAQQGVTEVKNMHALEQSDMEELVLGALATMLTTRSPNQQRSPVSPHKVGGGGEGSWGVVVEGAGGEGEGRQPQVPFPCLGLGWAGTQPVTQASLDCEDSPSPPGAAEAMPATTSPVVAS